MKVTDILQPKIANHSLLIGYYGGGNYGDELLLEVIQNIANKHEIEDLAIAYQNPRDYADYHHDFGYPRVNMRDKFAIFRAILRKRNIIVGGGGLWGLDFGLNVFLLSFLLGFSRLVLRKKIYLIGVGYYGSTTRLGHIGAWLAGKGASAILARDAETYRNFSRFNKRTEQDTDIAWYLENVATNTYKLEVKRLDRQVLVTNKTFFVALRRFQAKHANDFTHEIENYIANNPSQHFIVTLLEPDHIDPDQAELLETWEQRYENVQRLRGSYNPMALFLFFQKHAHELALIAPQFHAIITAHMSGVPFLPVVYDNKVAELLAYIGQTETIAINDLDCKQLRSFTDKLAGDVV
jgi:polysaccharide pyruvyl transferase WcaK-like protein